MPFHYAALTFMENTQYDYEYEKQLTVIVLYEPKNSRFYVYGERYPYIRSETFDFLYSYHSEQVGALARFIHSFMNDKPFTVYLDDVAIEQSDFDKDKIDFHFLYKKIRHKNSLIEYNIEPTCEKKRRRIKNFLKMIITEPEEL
jgi:hypothetical protein